MTNEFETITKAISGDKEAFCAVYDDYKDQLFRYAFYRLRDKSDAEDAVSECVLSAWKQIGNLRDPGAFRIWIFRILSACCNRKIKEQISRRDILSLDDHEPPCSDQNVDIQVVLGEALNSISDEERNMVLLSVVGGLKSNEISEITGLTAGSVRSSLSRSLKKMRDYLE